MVALSLHAWARESGEYVGIVTADPDPMQPGQWLIPAFCTASAPPSAAGQAAVWMGDDWGLVPDHRGQTWYGEAGPVIVDRLGDPAEFEPPLSAEEPKPPDPPMPDISDRQFSEGIWRDGFIAYPDHIAFIGPGTVPPPLQSIIDMLPDDETGGPTPRKLAQSRVTGATSYRFEDPLIELVRLQIAQTDPAWSPEHLRVRWLVWATY